MRGVDPRSMHLVRSSATPLRETPSKMRKTCAICGSKRESKKMKKITDSIWVCEKPLRSREEACVDHPDISIVETIKVLQKALKRIKVV